MNKNVITVTPNEKGEIFITLYGTKYQIVVIDNQKSVKKSTKASKKENGE